MTAPAVCSMLSWPPPDDGNPYVARLREALGARGVEVLSHRYLAALCARPKGRRWLHLHWPEWMLQDSDPVRYRARMVYLFGLLDLARAQGVSLAWTAHNLFGHGDPHPALAAASRRALLARCSVVFGNFDGAEAPLRAMGFRGRFALTPHPHAADDLPPAVDRPSARAREGARDDTLMLVSFGAIEGYKGLSAFGAALGAMPDVPVRYVIAGRAKDPIEHRALLALAARDRRIELREGYVAADALARLVVAADATVLPYRDFFTSGAAMLSLTLSTPLIAPPWHHFRSYVRAPFFAALPSLGPESLRRALDRAARFTPSDREAARSAARVTGYADIAATVHHTLFGTAP